MSPSWQQALDRYDWDAAARVFAARNWQWLNSKGESAVPDARELKRGVAELIDDFERCADSIDCWIASGRFVVLVRETGAPTILSMALEPDAYAATRELPLDPEVQ